MLFKFTKDKKRSYLIHRIDLLPIDFTQNLPHNLIKHLSLLQIKIDTGSMVFILNAHVSTNKIFCSLANSKPSSYFTCLLFFFQKNSQMVNYSPSKSDLLPTSIILISSWEFCLNSSSQPVILSKLVRLIFFEFWQKFGYFVISYTTIAAIPAL